MTELEDPRTVERLLLDGPPPSLSAWQRYSPCDVRGDLILTAIRDYLDEPATRRQFDAHEQSEVYPLGILNRLRELGLSELFSTAGGSGRTTAYHICALNELAARRDTSVAVTLSVNILGLLPAYLAADADQLEAIDQRIRSGNCAAFLLSELPHGSNILRNEARAERGTLDPDGRFVTVLDDEPCTHYRLNGEKHLINGATEHGLLFVCLRTRNFTAYDRSCEVAEPMKARGDFTLFWLDRGPGMTPLPRWHTLPARAADISGLRFEDCVVEANRVIGREHGGLTVAHKTLMLSRGGVSSLASGCLCRARDLAATYARKRNVYGKPILELGAIGDHLMTLEALNLLVAAISLKATALLNTLGLAASHYNCVAKVMACLLAEEGVIEGQRILGARALLRELPYERVIRDVNLFGIFDGTSHTMLEELSSRLLLEARDTGSAKPDTSMPETRAYYGRAPQPIQDALRGFRSTVVFPMVEHLEALDDLGGELSLQPLTRTAAALFRLTRLLHESGQWSEDQGTRFAAAELYARLEVLIACIEICDPDRRAALGMNEPLEYDDERDRTLYVFAVQWLGSRVIASLRRLFLSAEACGGPHQEALQELAAREQQLLRGHHAVRHRLWTSLKNADS